MKQETVKQQNHVRAAAEFERPLLLTAAQDIVGFTLGKLGRLFLFLVTCSSVIAVLLIFLFIIREAIPFFTEHSITEFLGSKRWYPTHGAHPEYGAWALIVGSFYVTAAALVFAVPIGLLAAVFMSDMVTLRIRNIFKPVMEILAGIPSVAYGFFAVLIVAPWMQKHLGFTSGTNVLNVGVILGIMAIPTIVSVAEDSLFAVGREIREAAYALGSTRAETIVKVVIPAGHSGIAAAVILGMMRAIGETMVVWMASGNAVRIPHPWWDISLSIRTITATIAGEMGETVKGSVHYSSLFALGLLLLVFTFVLNGASEHFLAQIRKRRGKI